MRTIAIFNLDQTLVPFDCNHAWGQHLLERGLDTGDFLVRQQAFMDQYNAGTLDIRAYLRFSMAATVRAGSTVAHQALADFVANDLVTDDLVWFTGEMVGVPSLQEGKVTRFNPS